MDAETACRQQRKAADQQKQDATRGIANAEHPDHGPGRDKPPHADCSAMGHAAIKNKLTLRSLTETAACSLPRNRISDIGLAALPIKTVVDHDFAAIR